MINGTSSALSLSSVKFVRNKTTILADISLNLKEGEFFCLLGRSGSGKTTLLRLISGLAFPTDGKIEIAGQDQAKVHPYKRNIGYVFQDPGALLPHLTVYENIAFPLKVGRIRPSGEDISNLVNRVMSEVELTPLKSRFPNELSGGEKQRVALARALVYKPSILLFDEPLVSLDNVSKERLLQHISNLRKSFPKTSCLYVTHDEREALRLGDRIGVLNKGHLVQVSEPTELLSKPQNADVAKLVGYWNLLTIRVDPQQNTVRLPEGSVPSYVPLSRVGIGSEYVIFGFPIHSVSVRQTDSIINANTITIPGIVTDTYVQNHSVEIIVKVTGGTIKIRRSPDESIPKLNEEVVCLIDKIKTAQFLPN